MIDFHQAGAGTLDEMVALIDACRLDLIAQGLYQWDENYPSRTFYRQAIQKGHAFILRQDEILAGLVVLDEWQHPSWRKVRWEPMGSRPLVIHSLAIHPEFQGQRLGNALLEACEDWARSNRFDSIRLDVFAENLAAVNLYRRHGYRLQGVMIIASKPAGHQQYDCYQKSL